MGDRGVLGLVEHLRVGLARLAGLGLDDAGTALDPARRQRARIAAVMQIARVWFQAVEQSEQWRYARRCPARGSGARSGGSGHARYRPRAIAPRRCGSVSLLARGGRKRPFHWTERSRRGQSAGVGAHQGSFGMLRIAVAALLLVVSAAAHGESVEEKAVLCGACHGLKGVPEDKSIPIIWGQNAGYLYLQFRDFQKGQRTDERMSAVAKNVVKEDALALAEYFAAKTWPGLAASAPSKADADTARRDQVGRLPELPPRGVQGHIVRTPPRRPAARLPFEDDDRIPQPRAQTIPDMSDLLYAVTPGELSAIAAYLAGL